MSWLTEYCNAAEKTDQLTGKPDHANLLAAGVFGEAGSVFSELKKKGREMQAYPTYRNRLVEEVGDLLWYLIRLSTVLAPSILGNLSTLAESRPLRSDDVLTDALALGEAAGNLLKTLRQGTGEVATAQLGAIWNALFRVASTADVDLSEAACGNLGKIQSRWPDARNFVPLFDDEFIEEEQLPRRLGFEFRQIERGGRKIVMLRCNGLNFGDRLTDNIDHLDFYRFHDVFHFAYAVYLGWSPVMRALLNCKRKSRPEVDENQDGARARIIEEAVSAIVFSRAKKMNLYKGIDHVDYDLLKTIQEFVQGFEVDSVPLWQWETAILKGYDVFRSLRDNRGGGVTLDMLSRNLCYLGPMQVGTEPSGTFRDVPNLHGP